MTARRIPQRVIDAVTLRDGSCMAPRLGGTVNDCWGRDRVEHVKDEPRMALKATGDEDHLLLLCQGHTEDGMRAGYVWATDAVNRRACRAYLSEKKAAREAAALEGVPA